VVSVYILAKKQFVFVTLRSNLDPIQKRYRLLVFYARQETVSNIPKLQ
jgi:hypothetical protein